MNFCTEYDMAIKLYCITIFVEKWRKIEGNIDKIKKGILSFMGYFYGTLFFELIFCIFCIYKIIIALKLLIKDKKKGYLILIIILVPLASWLFYNITIPKIKDIKYALNEDLLVHKGMVEKTYLTGKVNIFVLDGKEYQYNPWKFKPVSKNKYELHYLPNSRFVVKYEKEQ